jgi:hypothetical protein
MIGYLPPKLGWVFNFHAVPRVGWYKIIRPETEWGHTEISYEIEKARE